MDLDQAIAITIEMLKAGRAGDYGYELYPRSVARAAAVRLHQGRSHDQTFIEMQTREVSSLFYEAAWELCRRGIVRPGVIASNGQAVPDGGYSLTVAGRKAIPELDSSSLLIAQPGSLAATFGSFKNRFGEGFHQRATEAIKCRNAEAWVACCAMVGAAAESILLATAIAKMADQDQVLSVYSRSGGRKNVLNLIVGQADRTRRDVLATFSGIISSWRDEAAHGIATPLGTANADEALRQLLHMCQWVDREWDELTKPVPKPSAA